MCLPQCVPGAAGWSMVVQVPSTMHHNLEQICEQNHRSLFTGLKLPRTRFTFCSSPPARASKRKLPWRRTEACIGAPRYTSRQAVTLDTSNRCPPVRLPSIRLSLDCGSFETFFKNFPSLKAFKASNTRYLAKQLNSSFRLFERRIWNDSWCCRKRFWNFLLQKIGNVPSRTSGPGDANGVHFEGRRHHVQGVTVSFAAADFFRIVIHAKAAAKIVSLSRVISISDESWFRVCLPAIRFQPNKRQTR